jgi:hypothetical protein
MKIQTTPRFWSATGAVAVASIAAWSSWSHMVGVALRVGEAREVAYVLPLSVDGLLVTASAAMVADRQAGRAPRWSARVAFGLGVAASLAANIAHAHPNLGARIVAGWPALALLATVELLSRRGRRVTEQPAAAPAVPAPTAPVPAVKAAPRKRTPAKAPARKRGTPATVVPAALPQRPAAPPPLPPPPNGLVPANVLTALTIPPPRRTRRHNGAGPRTGRLVLDEGGPR